MEPILDVIFHSGKMKFLFVLIVFTQLYSIKERMNQILFIASIVIPIGKLLMDGFTWNGRNIMTKPVMNPASF